MKEKYSQIDTIVVPTCGRPDALQRCLVGILGSLAEHDRAARIIIADNSQNADQASQNRMIVETLNLQMGCGIEFIGREERCRILASLLALGFDERVAEFAINGIAGIGLPCTGANRNVLLLAAAGESFISVDDDTQPLFANFSQFTGATEGDGATPRFSNESPVQHWLYPSRDSLMNSVCFTPIDFFSAHEAILGYKLTDHVASPHIDITLGHRERTPSVQSSSVLITLGGLAGDCGWGSPSKYFFLNRSSVERFAKSDASYLKGVVTREMGQVSPGYCITERADDMMSTAFGCHGSAIFPPFLPVGRGQDILFARLAKRMVRGLFFGHVPYAILHDPLEKRRFWPGEALRSAASVDLSSFLCCLVDSVTDKDADDCDAFDNLGEAFIDLGNAPASLFRMKVEECRRLLTQEKRKHLEQSLAYSDSIAQAYVADVKAYLERLIDGERRLAGAIPIELLYNHDEDAALQLTQELVLLYGKLLLSWKALLTASLTLREVHPARRR